MRKEEDYIQKFRMGRDEYVYRIQSSGLSRFEARHRMRATEALLKGKSWVMRVLYYTVCWNGKRIEEDEFISEWNSGKVYFNYNRRELGLSMIRKRLMRRALKLERMNKL
ncbi:MAG: hypothetical protein NC311_09075 [Muribaculaceae bacterium]|nr:hypothetical protein [Muribaculaceae bacterium]